MKSFPRSILSVGLLIGAEQMTWRRLMHTWNWRAGLQDAPSELSLN